MGNSVACARSGEIDTSSSASSSSSSSSSNASSGAFSYQKSVFVRKLIWKPIWDGEDNGEEKLSRAGQSKSGQAKPGRPKVGQEIVKEEKISDENGRKPRNRTRSQTFSISSRQASKEKLELPTQNVKISTHTKNQPTQNQSYIQQKLRVMERKKNSIQSVKVRFQKVLKILQSFPKKKILMRLIRKFHCISGVFPVYFRYISGPNSSDEFEIFEVFTG